MNLDLHASLKEEFGTINRDKIFQHINKKYYPVVENFVTRNSGNRADAQDLFQESAIVLLKKLEEENFFLRAKLKTYLMAIAKNLWFKKLRDSKELLASSIVYSNAYSEELNLAIDQEKSNFEKLLGLLAKISDHCNKLINDVFFREIPIEEIQQKYGYTSRHNAQNQKHKCIQQIKNKKISIYG